MTNKQKYMEIFANRIKQFRISKKLNQSEFANILGVSDSYYSRLEGKKSEPTADLLISLYLIYNITFRELFNLDYNFSESAEKLSDTSLTNEVEKLKSQNRVLESLILQ